jgi:hypothetical protein
MNCFTALGVSGIIIFKCNLDPCGVWMWVLRLRIGCKGRCLQTLKNSLPTKARIFLKFPAGQKIVKKNSLPQSYSPSMPHIKTIDFLKYKPIKNSKTPSMPHIKKIDFLKYKPIKKF